MASDADLTKTKVETKVAEIAEGEPVEVEKLPDGSARAKLKENNAEEE